MVEAGKQRGLLAEVARQRDHLDVEAVGGEAARHLERVVAAAVVDIDDLARKTARLAQLAGDRRDARVQVREAGGLVVDRHDDRQAGLGLCAEISSALHGCRRHGACLVTPLLYRNGLVLVAPDKSAAFGLGLAMGTW